MSVAFRPVVAFDIGGTNTRAGLVGSNGQIMRPVLKEKTPTVATNKEVSPDLLPGVLVGNMARMANEFREARPSMIAVSMAGPITSEGVVIRSPNIWEEFVTNYNMQAAITEATGLPAMVVNDMVAPTMRESRYGLAQGLDSFFLVTVSTGVGSKLFSGGRVLMGEGGICGEIGHMVIDPTSDIECKCGYGRGHLESLASGEAAEIFARQFCTENREQYFRSYLNVLSQNHPEIITNTMLNQSANRDHDLIGRILQQVVSPLAMGINHVWNMSAFQRLFIIGGFALGMGDPYLVTLKAEIKKLGLMGVPQSEMDAFLDRLIAWGADDDSSGIIGAAAAAFDHMERMGG